MSEKYQCFNPFGIVNHRVRDVRRLRNVTASQLKLLNKNETLSDLLICDTCRLKIPRLSTSAVEIGVPSDSAQKPIRVGKDNEASTSRNNDDVEESPSSSLSGIQSLSEDTAEASSTLSGPQREEALTALNRTLISLGESPIKKRKLTQESYPAKKFEKTHEILAKKVFGVNVKEKKAEEDKNSDILKQLKDAFHKTDDTNLKIRILTLFTNWTFTEIQAHFNASKHMIAVAKKVKDEKGILSCANSKSGKRLDVTLVQDIVNFYELDDISRLMPGKKNYVTVVENGEKVQKQKRLVLCNLKEAYKEFRQQFPDKKYSSFSKFAELRPKHCVLAGASGTHTVCVCVSHQNVKLMLEGGKIGKISQVLPKSIETYRDCLEQIICNPSTVDCSMNNCEKCPGTANLIDSLQSAYDEELIETITYKQWMTVDRATLETLQDSVPDFLQKLSSSLQKLLPHAFIAEQQSEFLRQRKENLTDCECIVTGELSENYAFVFQDAIQGVHWNNNQATLHPFVIYFKEETILKHKSFVAISDCLKHDTVAVHLFQSKVIEIIKKTVPNVKKLIYFTDGAAAQYKNKKNFINLSHHQDDFGLAAEWHFFATSHGKGPCDEISGMIKRLAARTSLQRLNRTIKTPEDLFNWAKTNILGVECLYFEKKEYSQHEKILEPRFESAKPITGTKKFHSFIPICTKQIEVREFSLSKNICLVKIMK